MYHYMEFDSYLIREHNQQVFSEVQELRLEKRLRKDRGARGSRLVAFALRLKSTLDPLRRVGARRPVARCEVSKGVSTEPRLQREEGADPADTYPGHKDETFDREEYR